MAILECKKLERFFDEFASLKKQKETLQPISAASLAEFLDKFSAAHKHFQQAGSAFDIFEVCQLGRNEVRNCHVLAWLMDENGSHGLGNLFLSRLLAKCGPNSLSPGSLEAGYITRTEFCPNADNADRVDIVCDGRDFLLYIEVKIDSLEHANQTDRYLLKLKNNSGQREHALIFLSPAEQPANPKALIASWKDCACILVELAAEKEAEGNIYLARVLKQYASFVHKFQTTKA